MSRRSDVNDYLANHGVGMPDAPRYFINRNDKPRYYEPYRNCSNGSCRPWHEFAEENDEEELTVLYTANHVRTVMGWSLHHIWSYDDGGTNNISNLTLIPKGLNSHLGKRNLNLEEINELLDSKSDHWFSWYDIPKNFRVEPLEIGLLRAKDWVKKDSLNQFLSRAIYR